MNKSIQTEVKTTTSSPRQRSIRTRLLVILVLLVLVPAAIITVVSSIQETRNAEKQITAQL
jgi:flagellar basal body-associated protein FliL